MLALAHHFDEPVLSSSGTYLARVYAGAIEGGRWGGWIVFFPVGGGQVISTDRETTQSSIAALSTWAGGVTHTYLEGALQRALALNPDAELARELLRLERLEIEEASADAHAASLEAAATAARLESELVESEREVAEERVLATAADTADREAREHEAAAAASRRTAQAAEEALRARKKK
jgi:hypothetical protein